MDLRLQGQLAVVSGASRGIGAAIARQLAAEGCDVVLAGRSRGDLEAVARDIVQQTGRQAHVAAHDLSTPAGVSALVADWGHAEILVNNAGAIPGGRLHEVDEVTWREAWELKVFGYIDAARGFFGHMAARRSGVILNIIGAAAQNKDPSYICGVTGNSALTALTMSLGSDSHVHGIRVVGISPGPVATERLLALRKTVDSARSMPFGRAAAPEEIAAAAAFMVSPLSAYTSGAVLVIDGGMSARS